MTDFPTFGDFKKMNESNLPEQEAVDFVLWLMQHQPDALSKYAEDEDSGRSAIEDLYNLYKS